VGNDVIHLEFPDNIKGDLSIKKNRITDAAKYENIVYLHDYIIFDINWYNGFLKFGNDFDVCMNKINNTDGTRYRDWCLWKDDADFYTGPLNYLIPYDMKNLSGMMYISGAYWVAKKEFMAKNRLNEKLSWGQGEDVEWSLRVRDNTAFKMNIHSKVNLLKYKDRIFNEISETERIILDAIPFYINTKAYELLINNHLSQWI
jgi:hypothetical protein